MRRRSGQTPERRVSLAGSEAAWPRPILALLLVGCVALLQLTSGPAAGLLLCAAAGACWLLAPPRSKPFAATVAALACGYCASGLLSAAVARAALDSAAPAALASALSRLGLVGYVLPLAWCAWRYPPRPNLVAAGALSERVPRPFARGKAEDPVWAVLLIAAAANAAGFAWAIDGAALAAAPPVWFAAALLFAAINALLETIVWRGFVLSRCVESFGAAYGTLVCGAAFGAYHYAFVPHWGLCAALGLGGVALGWLALRSKGLLAPLLLQFALNLLFVFSGWLLAY